MPTALARGCVTSMATGLLIMFAIVAVLWVATSLVLRHSLLHDETEHRHAG